MMSKRTFVLSIILFGLVLLAFSYITSADETDWQSPENFYYVYNEFNNPEEALQQDDTYAQSDLDGRADEQDWYECDFSEITELTGCPIIDGIIVEFDAYAGGTGQSYEIKLTWNSGSSWTVGKISSSLPTVDTDTYISVGGSTDTWGRTWDKNDFITDEFGVYFHHNIGNQVNYLDHIRIKVYYTYTQPNIPSCAFTLLDTNPYCNTVDFLFTKGTGADTTLFKWSTEQYPTFSIGTQIYNGSSNSFEVNFTTFCDQYYIVAWSWNNTYCRYSQDYDFLFFTPCNWNINQIYNNTENITGTIETLYHCETGWKIWVNMTGNTTECDNTSLTLYEDIVNATGTHESLYSAITGWKVWSNYTGNDTGVDCLLKYLNFSDDNITVNITYWGCNNTNTSQYNINEDNWLNIASALLFDNAQIFLFILIALWTFFITKYYEKRLTIFAYAQLSICFPLCLSMALISLTYPFGFIIVFIIPIISIFIAYDGFVYGRNE